QINVEDFDKSVMLAIFPAGQLRKDKKFSLTKASFLTDLDVTIANLYFVSSLHDLDAACPHAYAVEQRLDDYLHAEMELAGHAYSSVIPISNFSLTVDDDERKFKQFLSMLHK